MEQVVRETSKRLLVDEHDLNSNPYYSGNKKIEIIEPYQESYKIGDVIYFYSKNKTKARLFCLRKLKTLKSPEQVIPIQKLKNKMILWRVKK